LLPSTQRYDLVVFGENSLDFVARTRGESPVAGKQSLESFRTFPGGQGATAALGAARLGVRTCYVGAFGADPWAATIRAALVEGGVHVESLERPGASTRTAVIVVEPSGDRHVYEHRDPGLDLDDPDFVIHLARQSRVLLVDASDIEASIAVARAAREAGVRVVVDIDRVSARTGDLLDAVDVLVLPESFVASFAGRPDLEGGLSAIAARFPDAAAVIATCGERGSFTLTGGKSISTPAFETHVVDTTGAGDAFRAGLCAAWCRGESLQVEDLLDVANATAALNCRALGAQNGLPDLDEVRALVTRARRVRSKS
jgi:sugar/nucleoside kinase (ribokinase family)